MRDAQGGEASAWALAASPKTLNFPDSHYNQGGTEKQAQWQMRLLRAGAGARGGCLCFRKDYCLIFIDSCAPCSSYPQNLELFTPGMLGGQGRGCLEPQFCGSGFPPGQAWRVGHFWVGEWKRGRAVWKEIYPPSETLGHRLWPQRAAIYRAATVCQP